MLRSASQREADFTDNNIVKRQRTKEKHQMLPWQVENVNQKHLVVVSILQKKFYYLLKKQCLKIDVFREKIT